MGYVWNTARALIILGILLTILASLSSLSLGNYAYFSLLAGTILSIISTKYDFERKREKRKRRGKRVKRSSSRR